MCDRFPRQCALRDNHSGQCMTAENLNRVVADSAIELDEELAELLSK
jgi:hypothetical protein